MRQADDPDASIMTEAGSPTKHDGDVSMSVTGTPKPKKERAKPKTTLQVGHQDHTFPKDHKLSSMS